jgi:hypothetical protein
MPYHYDVPEDQVPCRAWLSLRSGMSYHYDVPDLKDSQALQHLDILEVRYVVPLRRTGGLSMSWHHYILKDRYVVSLRCTGGLGTLQYFDILESHSRTMHQGVRHYNTQMTLRSGTSYHYDVPED